MRIYDSLDIGYDPSEGCVLAVGNFDGVHRGHQLIFDTAVGRAREEGLKAVLLTFSRHPASVVRPNETPDPLMAVSDRLKIARMSGFGAAFVLDFDDRMAAMPPARFVEEILVDRLGVQAVVAGENWRFGRGREGDMAVLASLGRDHGFHVIEVGPLMVDDLPVSSTRIRGALAAGDVTEAARLLGRPHFVRGTVVIGQGRGRKLGFPTVNLDCQRILVPAEGVYAGGFIAGGEACALGGGAEEPGNGGTAMGPAAVSIGSSPTFENGAYGVEAHLVGLERDLYGKAVTVAFIQRLREQRTFAGPAQLSDQIALDVEVTRGLYSALKFEEIPL